MKDICMFWSKKKLGSGLRKTADGDAKNALGETMTEEVKEKKSLEDIVVIQAKMVTF